MLARFFSIDVRLWFNGYILVFNESKKFEIVKRNIHYLEIFKLSVFGRSLSNFDSKSGRIEEINLE
jgi:hypothetical protein